MSVKSGLESVKCEVWSEQCLECGVRSVEFEVWSVESGVRSSTWNCLVQDL